MKHTYTFCIIAQEALGKLGLETLFSTHNEQEVADLKQYLLEQDAGYRRASKGKNSRPVVVVHVDTKEHEKWVIHPGRNGLRARPTVRGQKFKSAVEASGHVGLRHNEVAMLLSRG